jgi:hypothetical protein
VNVEVLMGFVVTGFEFDQCELVGGVVQEQVVDFLSADLLRGGGGSDVDGWGFV